MIVKPGRGPASSSAGMEHDVGHQALSRPGRAAAGHVVQVLVDGARELRADARRVGDLVRRSASLQPRERSEPLQQRLLARRSDAGDRRRAASAGRASPASAGGSVTANRWASSRRCCRTNSASDAARDHERLGAVGEVDLLEPLREADVRDRAGRARARTLRGHRRAAPARRRPRRATGGYENAPALVRALLLLLAAGA